MIFLIFAILSFLGFILFLFGGNIYLSVTYIVCAILNISLYIMNHTVKELRRELARFENQFDNNKKELITEIEKLKTQRHSHNQDTKKDKE